MTERVPLMHGVPVAPGVARRGACQVCRGPVLPRFPRCYRCECHRREAGGLLADAVVPAGYAVKDGPLARDLWRYKADDDLAAAERLHERLRAFLRDHGDCVRRAAGVAEPGWNRVAVVPSGQGRPGRHPLEDIVASCVALPQVRLDVTAAALARGREIGPGWVRVGGALAGKSVLVIDDTWVSGSSAQSTAVALRQAGATRVAVVVLGRHVDPADPRSAAIVAALAEDGGLATHECRGQVNSTTQLT